MTKTSFVKPLGLITAAVCIFFIIINPKVCTAGVAKGLLLAGRVIIPSLFPFTACVLFIMKSGGLHLFDFAAPFTKKAFRLPPELFSLMLLSFIGGYPVGAKLLSEAVKTGRLSEKNAGIMLNYCVNAGPAFVVLAVGENVLGSKKVGYILFAVHIAASLILSLFFRFYIKNDVTSIRKAESNIGTAENFVAAVSDAASSVFSVCAYVIFFSAVNEYISYFSDNILFLKGIAPFLEVTNAVTVVKNIPAITFLLGFAGISIWCQIISIGKHIKINLASFILSRIAHGLISAALCILLFKLCGIAVTVSTSVKYNLTYNGPTLSLSMISMVIVLLISLFAKKRTGNILNDVI